MKQIIKDFAGDIVRQLFGVQKPRNGKLIITRHAYTKMREFQLDQQTLHDVFRHGENVTETMIVRKYRNYSVSMFVKPDDSKFRVKDQYVVITCWKRENW